MINIMIKNKTTVKKYFFFIILVFRFANVAFYSCLHPLLDVKAYQCVVSAFRAMYVQF